MIKDRIESLQKHQRKEDPGSLREGKRKPETKDEIEQRLRREMTEGSRRSDYWLWKYECNLAIEELKEQIEKLEKQLVVREAIFGMKQAGRLLKEQSRIRRQLKEGR